MVQLIKSKGGERCWETAWPSDRMVGVLGLLSSPDLFCPVAVRPWLWCWLHPTLARAARELQLGRHTRDAPPDCGRHMEAGGAPGPSPAEHQSIHCHLLPRQVFLPHQ